MTTQQTSTSVRQPRSTIIRRSELRAYIGVSLSSIDRMRAKGDFPEPISLTGAQAVGWLELDIEAWIASRKPKTAH